MNISWLTPLWNRLGYMATTKISGLKPLKVFQGKDSLNISDLLCDLIWEMLRFINAAVSGLFFKSIRIVGSNWDCKVGL